MPTRRFVILEHTTREGVHHDLLIDRPQTPGPIDDGLDSYARTLWAARIGPPPNQWLKLGQVALTPLPTHRKLYLDYEGPIAGDRGSVQRVAGGDTEVAAWSDSQKTLRFVLQGSAITLTIMPGKDGMLLATISIEA